MDLTIGPVQGFWEAGHWSDFYARLADTPGVKKVVLGELVCSKRLPFYQTRIPEAVERLQTAGKEVALTSLALVTLKRERKMTAELAETGIEVEVNDLTALPHLPETSPFSVGPLVNVYNEGTLSFLKQRGAKSFCLPPELPLGSLARLVQAAGSTPVEAWGWGRLPLAISGRCYHARYHDRPKDQCQFVCADDPDGLAVDTLDDQKFLAINGVQTLSDPCANMAPDYEDLKTAGIRRLRLSPQHTGFFNIIALFHDLVSGRIDAEELSARALPLAPGGAFCNGFLSGANGIAWSGQARTP
ncbi:ubiquinone anaerobic biosynthesis protein UbiV [Roseibium suaedae]|uniref:Ubiquinone biosynthesis protein UbiV n=1 Tax=Roseibium suaedae TaxID=735517 RepID=A0A1M7KIU6_9HYPH|nr:U32 family peptidase [Roseibium suaedae]SHM65026.1 Collagenase-like protease, PrtC family [Roseibium suaedae]